MEGYIYILTNRAMPGLIKIGSTKRSPEERRRELSRPTGIPMDFDIAYEIKVPNFKKMEADIHKELDAYRFTRNKEFFQVGLDVAIHLLQEQLEQQLMDSYIKIEGTNERFERYEAIEILSKLKDKYPKMIQEDLVSVRLYQTRLRCYIETTVEKVINADAYKISLADQTIHRQDLAFIIKDLDPEDTFFNTSNSTSENARLFIDELDDYSKAMCCDELFTEAGWRKIQDAHFFKQNGDTSFSA